MIDGDNEEKKEQNRKRFGDIPSDDEEEEYDIVYGEADYPYWNFMGSEDRWLPTKQSLDKALTGKFEACLVRFANVGQLLVPWTKKKFRAELMKFAEAYELAKGTSEGSKEPKVLTLTVEQFKKVTGDESTE